MCSWDTQGTKHGCGHYIITQKLHLNDCKSPQCKFSSRHPSSCSSCREGNCRQFYGPDSSEQVTRTTPEYCSTCYYWYQGQGSKRRN